ncbi:N-acetyltransferase [Kaistia sp. 32K]|uniref:GNAT family N-acetyltransferase n=1 Tax=Kaistia sp. 32K TaxID=2795690 RepID=UPI001915AFF9|nr:GNAT family N-acetyltransferase [Kaistia sp. 32K]BCP54329.1 N-acetyltransferase [Kaistia sp. 32K]
MNVVIRPLAPADHVAWLRLWQGYLDFYERTLSPEITALTWARLHDAAEPMFALGAEQDGRLVGFAHAILHRSTWLAGHSCYLEDLFVSPDSRGGGVGRTLIEAVARDARERGCDRLHWLTHTDNATARRLYDQVAAHLGFVSYRRSLLDT